MSRLGVALVCASVALACGEPASKEANAVLGGEIAARVGDQTIPLAVVASVAESQRTSVRDAVLRLVDDAVAAAAAHDRGLDRRPPAAWRLVAARGRFTSDRVYEQARSLGPPTDDEVAALSQRHWVEVDRPPSVRVIHAIVVRPKDASLTGPARVLAGEVRRQVDAAPDDVEFEKRAKAVSSPGLDVRVERLPAFTEEGWVTEGGGRMDETFAKAAFGTPPGATSPVTETTFGWHVIRTLERLPERRMPLETRRIAFAEETFALRARAELEARLTPLREGQRVEISTAAEELMRSVTTSNEPLRPQAGMP